MNDFARRFARFDRAKKVVLSGYPDGETSEWHVQTSVRIGESDDNRRVTVLQQTEMPDRWMTVVMIERDGDLTVEGITVAEGEPSTDENAESTVTVDPAGIEIADVGTASYSERT